MRQTVEWPSIQARQGVALSEHAAQSPRDLAQHVVASRVTERIVDRLEAVEIENADGKGCGIVGTVADQAIDLVEEAAMVAKPGQRIGECQIRAFPVCLTGAKRSLHRCPCFFDVGIYFRDWQQTL
jgi:hypothetical protein